MRDRWVIIPHFYHAFVTCQVQVECPKSVPWFGHLLPTAVATSAQAAGPYTSQPLTHHYPATNKLRPSYLGPYPGMEANYVQANKTLRRLL